MTPEYLIERFVWQRDVADVAHPYKWDVKILERVPHPTREGEFFQTLHDAMTPDMAQGAFGFVKDDVSKVVNPFLVVDAAKARAEAVAALNAQHAVEGEVKTLTASLSAARHEIEALRAQLADAEGVDPSPDAA